MAIAAMSAAAQATKPNILIIWGDDIGQFNVSTYNMGMMGYRTPNIDRIGKEGAVFTTGTASRVAPLAAPRSSPGSRPSARVSPRSGCPVHLRA